jgi:hypothetical protein
MGVIRVITFSFSTLDALLVLYLILVAAEFECASIVWPCVMFKDGTELKRIERSS